MTLFFAEIKKILMIIRNDPRSIAAGIVAPSLVLIMFVLLFGGLTSMPVGIINNDSGPWGKRLESEILSQISPLGDIPYFANKENNLNRALDKFDRGILTGIFIIPEDFSLRVEEQNSPELIYYLNNFNTDFAKNMRLYFQEGLFSFYKKYYRDVSITIQENFSAPVQVEWVDIIAVGTLLLAFIIGGMFTYLFIFFKEKQYGTLLLYNTSPRNQLPSFAARIIVALGSSFFAGLVNGLLIYLILGFNVFVHLPILAPAIFFTIMSYIAGAALLGIVMKNFYGAVMGAMGSAMLLWFFSGGFTMNVPEQPVLLAIYRIIPNSYALDIIRGTIFHSSFLDSCINHSVLLGMMMMTVVFALFAYQNRVWKGISK